MMPTSNLPTRDNLLSDSKFSYWQLFYNTVKPVTLSDGMKKTQKTLCPPPLFPSQKNPILQTKQKPIIKGVGGTTVSGYAVDEQCSHTSHSSPQWLYRIYHRGGETVKQIPIPGASVTGFKLRWSYAVWTTGCTWWESQKLLLPARSPNESGRSHLDEEF